MATPFCAMGLRGIEGDLLGLLTAESNSQMASYFLSHFWVLWDKPLVNNQ
jgi:hypothetical protein